MHRITVPEQYSPVQVQRTAQGRIRWVRGYLGRTAAADGACAFTASLLAFEIRFQSGSHEAVEYVAFSLGLSISWWLSVWLAGGYNSWFIGTGSAEFHSILKAGINLTAALAIISYAAKLELARGYVVVALPCATAFDLAARYALRKRLHKLRRRGSCRRQVVAVGHPAAVTELVTELMRGGRHGLAVVAACLVGGQATRDIAGVPAYGGLDSVSAAVETFDADTVVVLTDTGINSTRLRHLAWELEKTGTDFCVGVSLFDVAGSRTTISPISGFPLLHVDHPQLSGAKQVIKQLFDQLSAATVLILLLPGFLAVALAIRLGDGGPVLFRQTRVGKNGSLFTLYKFRTMVEDAEQQKPDLTAANEADGPLFKIQEDPRITKVGAWLRRWSLDELPQLLNVLLGEMSLVGPRPALPKETTNYSYHVRRRLAVKPGITGLWQVSGRSTLSWVESVRFDLYYVENWTFVLDLQILWRTWRAVVSCLGAY